MRRYHIFQVEKTQKLAKTKRNTDPNKLSQFALSTRGVATA
jgi:hypothetical protein